MKLLGKTLLDIMQINRHKQFLLIDDYILTYEDVIEKISFYADWLSENNIKKNDRVACVFKRNCQEFIYIFIALLKIDAICVFVSPQISPNVDIIDSNWIITDLSPEDKSNIVNKEKNITLLKNKESYIDKQILDKAALIVSTSGTTGNPKWIILSSQNILYNVNAIKTYKNVDENDTFIALKHMSHISTITSDVLLSIISGAKLVINSDEFIPIKANLQICKYGVTILTLVPTILQLLLKYKPEKYLKTVKKISIIGGPIKIDLINQAIQKTPWIKIFCGYGLTEASSRVTYLSPLDLFEKKGSIGKSIAGTNIELLSDNNELIKSANHIGEIVICGPGVMVGYIEDNKIIINTGKLYTKDLAYIDEDGYYYHVGRKDDILVINGLNISAYKIERVIEEIPQIHAAYVFPIDNKSGMTVVAAIVITKENSYITEDEIYKYINRLLKAEMVPKRIWIVDEVPTIKNNKVSKKVLTDYFQRRFNND